MKKLLTVLILFFSINLLSASEVRLPLLTGPVVDSINLLTAGQNSILSEKLISFQKTSGSQIAVCIISTTSPLTIEDFGIKLAESWKIGRAGIDDGIIIIIAKDDRKMRIEVGYGLEHTVTDLRAGRIVDYVMAPQFRKGDFYSGIDSSVDSLITYINGGDIPALSSDTSGDTAVVTSDTESPGFDFGMGIIIVSIIVFIILIAMGKLILSLIITYFSFSAGLYLMGMGTLSETAVIGGFSMIPFAFIAIMMKYAPDSPSSGSSSYSSSSSSGSYRSSSGSSYSGGGGSFGGGGASGSW